GIFTLGEDTIHAQEELKKLKTENQEKLESIEKKEQTIKGFDEEITLKEKQVADKCWKVQQDIGNSFSNALVGYRSSKQKFFENCISLYKKCDKKDAENLEAIKEKYDIAYSNESQVYTTFPTINITEIQNIEYSSLLQKIITGST